MLIYRSADGSIKIDVRMGEETVWLTQDQMAALFGKAKSTINEHLKNIFSEGELVADSVIRNFRTTAADGKGYDTNYYNLDVIISVGYRVKSHQGTQFRIWATQVLREYLIKGFALNDERMKSGKSMNYFDELQERIREIRLSERVFYQKVKDIYTTSIDYDPKAEKTVEFFKIVQNKLLWVISSQTAAELIAHRADARLPMMGITSCDKTDPRRITKTDAATAQNYLTENENRHEKTGGTDEYQHSCQCERDPARSRRANRLRVSRIPQAVPTGSEAHGRVGGIPSRTPSEL